MADDGCNQTASGACSHAEGTPLPQAGLLLMLRGLRPQPVLLRLMLKGTRPLQYWIRPMQKGMGRLHQDRQHMRKATIPMQSMTLPMLREV